MIHLQSFAFFVSAVNSSPHCLKQHVIIRNKHTENKATYNGEELTLKAISTLPALAHVEISVVYRMASGFMPAFSTAERTRKAPALTSRIDKYLYTQNA
jgi:hypothetical protein